jgi:hypothetical protein
MPESSFYSTTSDIGRLTIEIARSVAKAWKISYDTLEKNSDFHAVAKAPRGVIAMTQTYTILRRFKEE